MAMLRYENVTFLKEPVQRQTRDEFIAVHLNVFWRDKEERIRRKMLGQVYDLIKKPARQAKRKTEN